MKQNQLIQEKPILMTSKKQFQQHIQSNNRYVLYINDKDYNQTIHKYHNQWKFILNPESSFNNKTIKTDQHCCLLIQSPQIQDYNDKNIIKYIEYLYNLIDQFSKFLILDQNLLQIISGIKRKNTQMNRQQFINVLAVSYAESLKRSQNIYEYETYDKISTFIYEWLDINMSQSVPIFALQKQYKISDKFIHICMIQMIFDISFQSYSRSVQNQIQQIQKSQGISRNDANKIIKKVISLLEISKYKICGSYRRGHINNINDIDILIYPHSNQSQSEVISRLIQNQSYKQDHIQILRKGKITSFLWPLPASIIINKNKNKKRQHIQIDLIFPNQNEIPFALLYLTGNRYFTIRMRQEAKRMGLSLSNFTVKPYINMKTEKDIFSFLKIPYVGPNKRII